MPASPSAQARASRTSSALAMRVGRVGVSVVINGFTKATAGATPCISWAVDAYEYGKLESAGDSQLVDRLRPVAMQQPRQGPIRQQASSGLATGTVIRLILCVDDTLHG